MTTNPTVCILTRVLRISRHSESNQVLVRRSTQTQVWRVVEALVQSTAITCAASMSLVVTFLNNASLGYPTCLNIFPALIVRPSSPSSRPSSPAHPSKLTHTHTLSQALVFSLTVLRIALNARSAEGRGADSSQSGFHMVGLASDQRTMTTMSTLAPCATLPEAFQRQHAGTPTRIHISTTTIVRHDFPKPPGLAGDFVLPLVVGY